MEINSRLHRLFQSASRGAPTVFLALAVCAVEPGQLADNQSRFGVIQGDAGFLSQGAKAWQEPHIGLPFEPGDHLRTADDSRIELQMSDKMLMVLEPDSEAVVEFASDRAGRVDLVEGTLLGIVDPAADAVTQDWEIDTPAATLMVHRASEFALQFSPTEGTHVGVFAGEVELQPAESAAGEGKAIRLTANQEARVTRKQPIPKVIALEAVMRAYRDRKAEMKRRQQRVELDWSVWNPQDRKALRAKYVAAPPKPKPMRKRVLKLKGEAQKNEASDLPGL